MISPVTVEDVPVIKAIAEKSWQATYRSILSEEQYNYMIELFYSLPALSQTITEQTFLLCKTETRAVGFVAYELNYPVQGYCKVHKLYVLPDAQGTGTGRKLLAAVEELAGNGGCTVLTLNVNKYNKALDFYQKVGFRVERPEVIDIGKGFVMDDYVLIKNLTPPSERVG